MDNIINSLYIVIAIALAAIFIYVIIHGFLSWSKSSAVPVVTVKATIAGKRKVHADGEGKTRASYEYYASFLNSEGNEKELRITENEYEALAPEMSGTLTYRGNIMLSFEAGQSSSDEKEVESHEE